MKSKVLIALAAVMLISGCATSQPTMHERGQLDLTFEAGEQAKTKSQTIAIVSPQFENQTNQQTRSQQSLYMEARQARVHTLDFNRYFYERQYASKLESAMGSGFQQLVTNKGFKFIGPYRNFDEITYTDKKEAYLAVIPDVELTFSKTPLDSRCSGSKCYENGNITVNGDFSFKLVEPLTQQTFLTKRISLSELNVTKSYRHIYDNPTQGKSGLVGMVVEGAVQQINKAANGGAAAQNPNQNVDTTEKALVEAINEFYQVAMNRMDTYLSAEEILSFNRDVASLKKQKRY